MLSLVDKQIKVYKQLKDEILTQSMCLTKFVFISRY